MESKRKAFLYNEIVKALDKKEPVTVLFYGHGARSVITNVQLAPEGLQVTINNVLFTISEKDRVFVERIIELIEPVEGEHRLAASIKKRAKTNSQKS